MVGAARFELATSRSQTVRTTRLCYAPRFCVSFKKQIQVPNITGAKAFGQVQKRKFYLKTSIIFCYRPCPMAYFLFDFI